MISYFKKIFSKKSTSKISNFKLQNAKQILSPNVGDDINLTKKPIFVVLHYTATIDAKSAIDILCNKEKEVSAHIVLDREGKVYQLVPFNKIAWHAGVSEWKSIKGLNKCSIGIEIVNAGKLEKDEDKFLTWDNITISKKEVIKVISKEGFVTYWHNYPSKQLITLKQILDALKLEYQITEIVMHSEVSPDRKIDPGPAFPIDLFRE